MEATPMINPKRPEWTEKPYKGYILMCGAFEHMIPHVPTQEMVENHPWHVYTPGSPSWPSHLAFTGTQTECKAAVNLWLQLGDYKCV